MASILRGVMVSMTMAAAAAAMACDPKVADVEDDDGELEQTEDDDGDEDPSASGPDTDAPTTGDDDGEQPGTSVGSGPDDPGCDGDGACPEPPPAVQHAYAIRFGDLPPVDAGETDTGGSGDTEIDPDTLLVVITTGPDDCDDPWAALACGQWAIHFSLPPGTEAGTFALFPELNGFTTATGPADAAGECWWGGGSLEGTLELTHIDGSEIVGRIYDAQSFDFDANVAFTATLCG